MDFNMNLVLSQYSFFLPFTIYATPLFLFVFFWFLRQRRSLTGRATKATLPPEAGGAWPLIGHLHLLGGSQPPHVTLGEMADKYGPIFTLRLGVHRTLIVSNSEIAKEIFTGLNDKAFASRPKSLAFEILGYNFSMIGLSPYSSYWRHVRKIATVEVLSAKRIEMLKHVMESEVKAAMKESYDYWVKSSADDQKQPITEMSKWFGDITLNVLFRTVLGKRFIGVGCDGDEEKMEKIRKALRDFFDLSGSYVVSDALPFLRWLDLDGQERKMNNVAKELDEFIQACLEQHKHNRRNNNNNNKEGGKQDFMDVLLSTVDDEGFDGRDADTIIKATCLALILAGADTTSGTLTWTLSLLLNNPNALKKAQHELDTQIGSKNMAMESDLTKLEYLRAVINETLRLYPPSPLSLPHESMEDCTIGGYHVPAGTRLFTNISKFQRDPSLYSNPLDFSPERFLVTHKDTDIRGKHFELIPFGSGRRMCPGVSFGLQLIKITLATLVHGFDIETFDGRPTDMVEQSGLTNIKASPLKVTLKPRLPTQVYR